MPFGDCTNPATGEPMSQPLSSAAGGNELDITRWGARKINLSIADVQRTIQEGISAGPITPFNISGNTNPGSQI